MMRADIKERIEQVQCGEVPKGYIYTRAMLSPMQWSIVPLNSVVRENKDRNEEGLLDKNQVLSVSGVSGVVNQIKFMGRSYAGESVLNYHVVYPGNIVYTKSPLKENPYGIIKLNKGDVGIVSTLYAVYHCVSPIIGLYLDHYFSVDKYLNNYLKPLVKRGAKNDMKVNNEDAIKGLIPLPTIPEQKKIVDILTHLDKVIEQKKQLVEEKRRRKRWLMQNLLDPDSGIRLPGFEQEWEEITLGDIGDNLIGLTYSPDDVCEESGTLVLRSSNIKDGKLVFYDNVFVSCEVSPKIMIRKGDIVICARNGSSQLIGKAALVADAIENCTFGAFMTVFRCNNYQFVFQLLQTSIYREQISKTLGARINQLTSKSLQAITFQIPIDEAEQTAIANILSTADCEIELLEQEVVQWQTKKKSLMQLLLTGIVRVHA